MPATWVHWTKADEETIREFYPALGARAVAAMLNRTRGAVRWRARLLKVKTRFRAGPGRRTTPEQRRATRHAWYERKGYASTARRRQVNIAEGKCRCGADCKPKRRMCETCLLHGKRWSYWHRYGVRPVSVCAFCSKRWAAPGSKYCQRHEGAAEGRIPTRTGRRLEVEPEAGRTDRSPP